MSPPPIRIDPSLLMDAALSKRSPLYRWLMENHDTFAEVLKKAPRPNWEALASTFGDQGLTDAAGNRPSEECVRQTWGKVRKALKARRDRLPNRKPPPVVAQPAPTDAVAHDDDDGEPRIVLKKVKIRR